MGATAGAWEPIVNEEMENTSGNGVAMKTPSPLWMQESEVVALLA